MPPKNILITGAARRIGAAIACELHAAGHNLILHYGRSRDEAEALAEELNRMRRNSAMPLQADLVNIASLPALVEAAVGRWGGLDALVNNASSFFPTPLGTVSETQWDELLGSNLKAPFFLSQAAALHLRDRKGVIVNLIDIHAERGLKDYPVYSLAKAALAAMTKSLAKELAPEIRVNGVAPGAILWPEHDMDEGKQADILARIPLQRPGAPRDIALAVRFFIDQAPYVTGQILAVDGGRTVFG
ncbi:pteridine reductase [Methylococcus sp. EFPC2]|nr:pteridine reductase [Methylococcus sp. EFPC2]QSA99184.1 pteridine reductase [Methylococcus sp. EFPC2]